MTLLCWVTLLVVREEQFHLCHVNWCLHSEIAICRPFTAATVTSGFLWQSSRCSLVSPGIPLHLTMLLLTQSSTELLIRQLTLRNT
jgi:hypothetical protein